MPPVVFGELNTSFAPLRVSSRLLRAIQEGHWPNPCYLDVCARVTGHAESVLVEYDRSQVSYEALLDVFWNCHDPTQINRQGPDRGEQYRSVIFYHNSEQEKAARLSKQKLQISGKYDKDIATEIKPAGEFYMAEDYHQQYIEKKRLSSEVIS